jgi:hypothetical protein
MNDYVLYDKPPRVVPGPPYSEQGLTEILGSSDYTRGPNRPSILDHLHFIPDRPAMST